MQSTGSAKSDERIIARIVAALDGDNANSFFHHGVGHGNDALGKRLDGTKSAARGFYFFTHQGVSTLDV